MDIRTLERAAQIMGLLILKESAVAEAEERVSGELLTELLMSSPQVTPAQRARAQARGVDIASFDTLVVAESAAETVSEVSRRLRALAADRGGLAGEHLGRATLLLHTTDLADTARTVHARLRRDLGGPVRVVAEWITADGRGRAFDRAGRCCSLMQSLGVIDQGATTDQYAMFALLFDAERGQDLDRFLADSTGPLLQYDRRRSTQLVLGRDWRATDTALQLHVALRLHALRTRVEPR